MHEEVQRRPGRPARPVTREHLLRFARDAFSELGYAGASMGDIAERAGIRKSSLFHHFATKEELYTAALKGVVDAVGKEIAAAIQQGGTALESLDRATAAVQRYLGENPVAARLLVRAFVGGDSGATVQAVDMMLKEIVTLLENAMERGEIPRQDARQLALSIVGVHFLFFATPQVSSRLVEADVFAPEQVELRVKSVCEHLRRMLGAPVMLRS